MGEEILKQSHCLNSFIYTEAKSLDMGAWITLLSTDKNLIVIEYIFKLWKTEPKQNSIVDFIIYCPQLAS